MVWWAWENKILLQQTGCSLSKNVTSALKTKSYWSENFGRVWYSQAKIPGAYKCIDFRPGLLLSQYNQTIWKLVYWDICKDIHVFFICLNSLVQMTEKKSIFLSEKKAQTSETHKIRIPLLTATTSKYVFWFYFNLWIFGEQLLYSFKLMLICAIL